MIDKHEKLCINCIHELGICCSLHGDAFLGLDERYCYKCDDFEPKYLDTVFNGEDIVNVTLDYRHMTKYVTIWNRKGQKTQVYIGQDLTEALKSFFAYCNVLDRDYACIKKELSDD